MKEIRQNYGKNWGPSVTGPTKVNHMSKGAKNNKEKRKLVAVFVKKDIGHILGRTKSK